MIFYGSRLDSFKGMFTKLYNNNIAVYLERLIKALTVFQYKNSTLCSDINIH